MDKLAGWLALLALILSGLIAGFFYTWSVTVMTGFDAAAPNVAIEAMQAVNANIRTPRFGAIFFGTPMSLLVVTIALMLARDWKPAMTVALAFLAAALVIVITFAIHVPMNDVLAQVPSDGDAQATWQRYSTDWTRWNHVRAALAIISFALTGWAMQQRR